MTQHCAGRRRLLAGLGGAGLIGSLPVSYAHGSLNPNRRPIPATGETIPAIGMGSWLTFDVGTDATARATRVQVLGAFFALGGALVDSSPMYRSSEAVIGHCLDTRGRREGLFSATKVWKYGRQPGIDAMAASRALWGVERFDLMQIHNMLDWRTHLETLRELKADGRLRYIGITTSHGRRHTDLERVIAKEEAFDFVQFTYNVTHREAEQRLLPLASEYGKAVIINRPLDGGQLFARVAGRTLPGWAAEIGCKSWSEVFLKFALSHPAVTCAIPATSRVDHMHENMAALHGTMPDADIRRRIVQHIERA